MMYFDSSTYTADIKRVLDKFDNFNSLDGKKIFITGSTGLIGSAVLDLLIGLNNFYNKNVQIYAASRSIESLQKRFGNTINENWFHYVPYNMESDFEIKETMDYYIHIAGKGNPASFKEQPTQVIIQNITSLQNILEHCTSDQAKLLYISTSEIYGILETAESIKENKIGTMDILSSRSCYSSSKRCCETLCASYASERNTDFVIVRPGHIYGPTATRSDNRISSAFMYDSFDGKDLIMKSNGMTLRSYCYVLDCASAILFALINGQTGEAYNISNPASKITIKEMAEEFAKIGNVKLIINSDVDSLEKKNFNPMQNASLDSSKLESLGWKALFSKDEGFEHSIKILKEIFVD